tara:strand:- start:307 stop:480 length:174 start_codon:yes stop_codon:yes gene_type:complete
MSDINQIMGIMFTKILECDLKLNIFGRSSKTVKFKDRPLIDIYGNNDEYISFDEVIK